MIRQPSKWVRLATAADVGDFPEPPPGDGLHSSWPDTQREMGDEVYDPFLPISINGGSGSNSATDLSDGDSPPAQRDDVDYGGNDAAFGFDDGSRNVMAYTRRRRLGQ